MGHIPVLSKEVIDLLNPQPGEFFLDATVGGGGHARLILERIGPQGKLLGMDRDPDAIERTNAILSHAFPGRAVLLACPFSRLEECARTTNFPRFTGILLDLGISSDQLEDATRGFSFEREGPLDMRFNRRDEHRMAADIINTAREEEIYSILKQYGEERRGARYIAKTICSLRKTKPFITTKDLALAVPLGIRTRKANPKLLARVFQAFRIAVNNELEELAEALPQAVSLLRPHGRLSVISFHSLEDRIVKHFFRAQAHAGRLHILTKKPVIPSGDEVRKNPRARSAKMRVAHTT